MSPTSATHRHLLDVAGLSWSELTRFLSTTETARQILGSASGRTDALKGINVTTLFYEASTRTRISFENAAKALGDIYGGHVPMVQAPVAANIDEWRELVIRALTDDEIRGTVDRIGRENIDGWTASQGSLFADPLIHNRDRLRRDNVFANYYRGVHPTVHTPLRQLLAPLVNVNHDTTHIAMMCIAGAPGAAGAWLMRHLACGAAQSVENAAA